jgi:tetratricopeptide (TPR) repeat protein
VQNPFLTLGIPATSDAQAVRDAYRRQVKVCHPDVVQGEAQKQQAQEKLIKLNLAYEQALRLACRPVARVIPATPSESMRLAKCLFDRRAPESALRVLERCQERRADWYYLHGRILHELGRYGSAHQSFRRAIRFEPENNDYRAAALKAYTAERNSRNILYHAVDWALHLVRRKG